MMGNVKKPDMLDAKGLAKLLHLDSLPTVWLPPGEIRDERELQRTRMALSKLRTALKNRMHATLAKYGIRGNEHSDIFVGAGRLGSGPFLSSYRQKPAAVSPRSLKLWMPSRTKSTAVGVVACHLAEAAFWALNGQQPCRPLAVRQAPSKQVQGRA